MNKQAAYITQAHLILVALAAGFWIFSKIPVTNPDSDQQGSYAIPANNTVNLSPESAKGKMLFTNKCASCHSIFKDMIGPALGGLEDRGPWSGRKQLYEWIRDPQAFMKANTYTQGLKEKYSTMMSAFPSITNEEIDAILYYIMEQSKDNAMP